MLRNQIWQADLLSTPTSAESRQSGDDHAHSAERHTSYMYVSSGRALAGMVSRAPLAHSKVLRLGRRRGILEPALGQAGFCLHEVGFAAGRNQREPRPCTLSIFQDL